MKWIGGLPVQGRSWKNIAEKYVKFCLRLIWTPRQKVNNKTDNVNTKRQFNLGHTGGSGYKDVYSKWN